MCDGFFLSFILMKGKGGRERASNIVILILIKLHMRTG